MQQMNRRPATRRRCWSSSSDLNNRGTEMGGIFRFWAVVAIALSWLTSAWAADNYPSKPIRIVIPYTPGGPIDAQARIIAKTIQARLNVPVVVESRPGANQIIGANHVAQSPADGYTL